jgi:hypothetical protein
MNPLKIVAACLPLLLAAPAFAAPALGEIGGRVLDETTHRPVTAPGTVWIQAFEKGHSEVADAAPVEENGRYILLLQPGEYSIQVLVNGREVEHNDLTVDEHPISMDFTVQAPQARRGAKSAHHAGHHQSPRPRLGSA